ncbi:protein of unknown function [Shewanella benthica]|uniref:Uncharacterized protein n=1 Tax=Shewanella benthica TaxID=43661 RepID=A0A330MAB6_9GAMM|nr:protein of unknown function [Shewanella benthica]
MFSTKIKQEMSGRLNVPKGKPSVNQI